MKLKITLIVLLALFLGNTSYSQTEKTLDPNTNYLNIQIMGDTASDGTRVETTYILMRDSVYYVSGAFNNYDFKLHMKAADGDGAMPIVQVYQNESGEIPWAMAETYGDMELEDIYINAQPPNAEQSPVAWPFVTRNEGTTVIFEGCIFANAGQGGFAVFNAAKYVKVNNCKFYNMGNIEFQDLGNGRLVDCRDSQIDSLIVTNNTIVNSIDRVLRHRNGSGPIKDLVFDHNTIVNNGSYHGFIELGNVGNTIQITNNLIVDGMAFGADQSDATRLSELNAHGETDGLGNPLMVWIGSIPNDTTTYTISHNVYSISSDIQAFYTTEGVDEGPDQLLTDHIKTKLGSGASTALVKMDVPLANIPSSLANVCSWYYSPTGADKQKVTTSDVNYDRKSYDYWLNDLDCGYVVNDNLLGSDGLRIGDLNWEAKATGVNRINGEEGFEFVNYPNPFSDFTTLQFNLKQSSEVTIAIYDITGKSVRQINAGSFSTGLNTVVIQRENLLPGVYMLSIEAGSQHEMKKIAIK